MIQSYNYSGTYKSSFLRDSNVISLCLEMFYMERLIAIKTFCLILTIKKYATEIQNKFLNPSRRLNEKWSNFY